MPQYGETARPRHMPKGRTTVKAPPPTHMTYADSFVWAFTPKCPHCGQRFSTCLRLQIEAAYRYAHGLIQIGWRR